METRGSYSMSTLVGASAALVVAVGLLALLVPTFYASRVTELKAERGWNSIPLETVQAKSAQAARLKSYAWINREKGVVALPIECAMELVAAESASSGGVKR